MRFIHFDSVGGASGNMILGALLDLGCPAESLQAALQSLAPAPFTLKIEATETHGFVGTHVGVDLHEKNAPHRHLHHVVEIIERSEVDDATQTLAITAFTRLAEAEAKVHGCTLESVHFHEVGALDAIVDIVGVCLALKLLDVDAISVGPLPIGSGTTRAAHGVMPLPVPATAALIEGHPTVQTDEPFELVTPTGAALLMAIQAAHAAPQTGRIVGTGHGFGTRSLNGRPNLLRARLMETASGTEHDSCIVLECDIDDALPEHLSNAADVFMAAGALDVTRTAVTMKKGRLGCRLTVLTPPALHGEMIDLIFANTPTFGVREHSVSRSILQRRFETVSTPYGDITVKVGSRHGKEMTASPEHHSCAAASESSGAPIRDIYDAAKHAWAASRR